MKMLFWMLGIPVFLKLVLSWNTMSVQAVAPWRKEHFSTTQSSSVTFSLAMSSVVCTNARWFIAKRGWGRCLHISQVWIDWHTYTPLLCRSLFFPVDNRCSAFVGGRRSRARETRFRAERNWCMFMVFMYRSAWFAQTECSCLLGRSFRNSLYLGFGT